MPVKLASTKAHGLEALLLILIFLTPLFYTAQTHELFEFPKMYLVYFAATAATAMFLFRSAKSRKIEIARTKLDLPIIIFLISYFISTLFSVDWYTSIFGYYSRFNGGLLSVVGFVALTYILATCLKENPNLIKGLVNSLILSAFLVALFAVAQHFGYQKGQWVQDSSARVFSSLGQPNWLAAFLTMIFPLSLALLVIKPLNRWEAGVRMITVIVIFSGFWFTYSLSGLIGMAAALSIFFLVGCRKLSRRSLILLFVAMSVCALIAVSQPGIFSARLNSLFKQLHAAAFAVYAAEARPVEYEGDTMKIRVIVWRGALELLRQNPKALAIGTGPETFAYAFLPYRPAQLNQTSEWDFLYNKAHNDYIDIWVDRGTAGLLAYLILTGAFALSFTKSLSKNARTRTIQASFFSGWVGLLVTNFFGWSVVPTSLLFWLFPVLTTACGNLIESKNENQP
ncbi:MAG: O-antigen ligase family protein [Patescibacteria group bacterium]